MGPHQAGPSRRRLLHNVSVVAGAMGLTALFLLAPLLTKALVKPPGPDFEVRTIDPGRRRPPGPVETGPLDFDDLDALFNTLTGGDGWGPPIRSGGARRGAEGPGKRPAP